MKKKLATILFLMFLSFTTVFADGDMTNGGKSCQGSTSCLTQGTINDDKIENDKFSPYSLFIAIQNKFLNIFS